MTTTQQLELELDGRTCLRNLGQRRRRVSRARWWFQQMHAVVERAMDWSAAPVQPEQTYLRLVRTR
jgi:hypothetical protein